LHPFVHSLVGNCAEPRQGVRIFKYYISQPFAVQYAIFYGTRKEFSDFLHQFAALLQHLMVEGVTVDCGKAHGLQHGENRGFSTACAAGDADHGPHGNASTIWNPAAFFSRLPTASPRPSLPGHWAQISGTGVSSNRRRASKTRRACSERSAMGPRSWTSCPANSGRNSEKQMIPASFSQWAAM